PGGQAAGVVISVGIGTRAGGTGGGLGDEVVVVVPPVGDLGELAAGTDLQGVAGQPVHRIVVEGLGAGLAAGGGDGLQPAGRVIAVGEGTTGDRVGGSLQPTVVVPGEG